MPLTFVYPFIKIDKDKGIIRPMIPVIIENPFTKQQVLVMALLDTGADACLFPAFIPNKTGHDLKHQDVEMNVNVGIEGNKMQTWKHTFKIHLLEHGTNKIVWTTKRTLIDCVDHDNLPPLLGGVGFLQSLNLRFHYKTSRIAIELP
jgi:predicted aspartyl protease